MFQQFGSKRHGHNQDEAQREGEKGRISQQAGPFVVIHNRQSEGHWVGDERVVDCPQKEDRAEKEGEFP